MGMRVTVVSRDGEEFAHNAPDVHVTFEDDHVQVVEEHNTPSGMRSSRTFYLRESIARIVEHDYIPEGDRSE
jgi:hypothetical protein